MFLVQWSKQRNYSTTSYYRFYLYNKINMSANINLNKTIREL